MVQRALRVPGITPSGAAWLAKAIHPSDAVFTVEGIPTLDACPTAPLNYTATYTIPAPAAAKWNCEVILNPSPTYFGKVITGDGAAYGTYTVRNQQLGVSSVWSEFGAAARTAHSEYMTTVGKLIQNYRLTYASVTATLSASSTQNEGSVACAQYSPSVRHMATAPAVDLTSGAALSVGTTAPLAIYPIARRGFGELQNTPGGVAWEAKKGVYSILKLDGEFDKWRSSRDTLFIGEQLESDAEDTQYGNPSIGHVMGVHTRDFTGAGAATAYDCIVGPQGCQYFGICAGTGATATNVPTNSRALLEPSCSNISHIKFQNLDPDASVVVTMRVGFEATVPPQSTLIGQVGAPMEYDPVALATYFGLARQMLAAYPSEYNVFGALFNVAKSLLPHAMPLIRQGVGMLHSYLGEGAAVSSAVETTPLRREIAPPLPPRDRIPRQTNAYRPSSGVYSRKQEVKQNKRMRDVGRRLNQGAGGRNRRR